MLARQQILNDTGNFLRSNFQEPRYLPATHQSLNCSASPFGRLQPTAMSSQHQQNLTNLRTPFVVSLFVHSATRFTRERQLPSQCVYSLRPTTKNSLVADLATRQLKDENMVLESNADENIHDHAASGSSGPGSNSTGPSAAGASSDSVSRIPQPIFAVVAPPMVTSTSREALIEWLKLRDEYVETTTERCKAGKEDLDAVLKSVKNAFDSDLLTTLCEATWGVPKEELTDEFLLEQIHVITDSYNDQTLPPVNELFQKELKMNMNNSDIQSRVTDYFMSCNKLIKKYGLSTFFEGEKGTKKKCKLLVNSLPRFATKTSKKAGATSLPFCADSGADRSGMSMAVYEEFVKVCPEVRAVSLEEPITCTGADGKPIQVDMSVQLHLRLRTVAGSVRIAKPVECLIIPGDTDEILLGNDVLTMLGINVQRQLDLFVANAMQNEQDDEFDDVDEPQIGSCVVLSEELRVAVEKLIEIAIGKGFPREFAAELRRIATRFKIWRLKLGDDPPARIPPMKVRLKPGTKPYRCKARRYPPEVRKVLDKFNDELVRLGWVHENTESRWACPVLPVRKSGGEFWQTSDYKPVNAFIEAIVGVMPDLHVDLEDVKGEQKCLEELLHKHLLVWIDDLLLFAEDIPTYLAKLERLFELLDFFGFKISPKKSSLFEREVRWCGKLINGAGVHHDPVRIRALQELPYPKTAGELQQFLCATNWMRDSLIDYARIARPLQDTLDAALSRATKRTKRVASGIAVDLGVLEKTAYDEMKNLLLTSMTLAFPKEGATMCLLTDASDLGWSVLVTQVVMWQPTKEVHQQQHERLVCLSGSFTGSQCNWCIIEKEAYLIVCACEKLSYRLLRPGGFRLYCDHRNLVYVFAPGKEVKKHIRGKLLRLSTKLMEYRYEVEHIDGDSNVWADMVSGWAGNHDPAVRLNVMQLRKRAREDPKETEQQPKRRQRRKKDQASNPAIKEAQTQQSLSQQLRPLDDPEFEWPTLTAVRAAQQQHAAERPRRATGNDDDGWSLRAGSGYLAERWY
ncbi:unnamed protein product [Phytophthora fragariaefolia]|uniref:Unnamed protein product n=1 Tax=Phytophthora fragariaefolia TaxID=1490495 RepID=A0A9W6XZE1_9STRA|nr:unnamed protein product [Phytophthora fragariaefolia]